MAELSTCLPYAVWSCVLWGALCGDRECSKPSSCDRLQLTRMLPFLQDHTPLMAKIRDPWVKRDKLRVLLPRVRETTGQITGSVSSFRPACPTPPLLSEISASRGQGTEVVASWKGQRSSAYPPDLFSTHICLLKVIV